MGIIERKRRDRQRRIKEILDGARDIFNLKGFRDSTMNDIADMSNLSRRTLYLYFHNKEEILLTIAVNTLHKLVDEVKKEISPTDSGLDKVMTIAGKYRDLFLMDSASFQFIPNFTSCVQSLGKEDETVISCERTVQQISGIVEQYLIEGMHDKSIRKFENSSKIATILISMMHSFIQSVDTDNDLLRIALHIDPTEFINESLKAMYHFLSTE
ncbi:MAG: TetR/AcrR family transcriptional regulator [Spirochaetia bacterium]|jgi:AcrR family transcriptional regulator|nr:TetR/AcrR family transcriptional regulator [Spirochaetia bacterium]